MHPLIKNAYNELDQTMTLIDKHAARVATLAEHFSLCSPTLQCNYCGVALVLHLRSDSTEEVSRVLESLRNCGFVTNGDTLGWSNARQANLHYKAQDSEAFHAMVVVTERTEGSLFDYEGGKLRWLTWKEVNANRKTEEGREYHEDGTVVINHTDGTCEEFPPSCRHLVPV